jgi:hypothetical protein
MNNKIGPIIIQNMRAKGAASGEEIPWAIIENSSWVRPTPLRHEAQPGRGRQECERTGTRPPAANAHAQYVAGSRPAGTITNRRRW